MATLETEGKGLERNLNILGIQANYVGGTEAPQLFRFNFITHGAPTTNRIKTAVARLRQEFGDYMYDDTPTGKGFSIIRPFKKPNPVYLTNAQEEIKQRVANDPNGRQNCHLYFGKDENGNLIFNTLDSCKSMLVAGTAGSGKSCFLNSVIMQLLLYSDARLVLIDPKRVEFASYADDIHNRIDAIAKEPDDALRQLQRAFNIMLNRYKEMEQSKPHQKKYTGNRLVIVIDEFAALMKQNKSEIEPIVCRIAAEGRAAGVHLIIATQNPCADVITSLIKYNLQTLVCLKTTNARHSMNVIDCGKGATLLGRGDAYIKFEDDAQLIRCQTPYITDDIIEYALTH